MKSEEHRISSYKEFWPYYLHEHSKPLTRQLHIFGTVSASCVGLPIAIKTRKASAVIGGIIFGYFWAWFSHFFIEKNRPATFKYPLWSFYSDFRMVGFWVLGTLDNELQRAGLKRE
mmetsp:Transcript_17503/g.22820  ORF Transcript_17503/g.22820 Transcript_17503/m.22820 type:complete len:116 (+) Transcript_17503:168-515(+)